MSTALEQAVSIAQAVRDAGGRALIVGGWVRDRLLGLLTILLSLRFICS